MPETTLELCSSDSDTENQLNSSMLNVSYRTYSSAKKRPFRACLAKDPYNIFEQELPKKRNKVMRKRKVSKKRKKSDLWKEAMKSNAELAQFVDSFNKELEEVCSHELSIVTDTSFDTSINTATQE